MSDDHLEPLDPDLATLYGAEREPIAPPHGAQARVLARVERTLGFDGPGGGHDGGDGGGSAGHAAGPVAKLLSKPAMVALGGILAGALAGAAAVTSLRPAPPVQLIPVPILVTVPVTAPSLPDPPSSDSAAPTLESVPPPAPASAAFKAPSAGSASQPAGKDTDLAAERALLEIARNAVGRGRGDAAIEALGRHAAEFPRGRLAEEREALWIQALDLSGRKAEARARAERFRSRFPKSLLRPAVDATLENDFVTDGGAPAQSPR